MRQGAGAPAPSMQREGGRPPSSTIHVGGMPTDATVREMAHIFRPFPGFKVPADAQNRTLIQSIILCTPVEYQCCSEI